MCACFPCRGWPGSGSCAAPDFAAPRPPLVCRPAEPLACAAASQERQRKAELEARLEELGREKSSVRLQLKRLGVK